MRIALTSNRYKDPGYQVLARVNAILKEWGCITLIDCNNESDETAGLGYTFSDDFSSADFMISLGGDGTFLNAVHATLACDIPVVGVNLGSVGFLTEINLDELEGSLRRLMEGDFRVVERMMLEVRAESPDGRESFHAFALNDAVLSRCTSPRIVPINLYIDGHFIELIRSDGIVVSTATGSTGYSMAAGGPIIQPDLHIMQVTPICPHSLQNRAYVLSPDTTVTLELSKYPFTATVSVDGRQDCAFRENDKVHITRAERPLRMVHMQERNFLAALPDKLRVR